MLYTLKADIRQPGIHVTGWSGKREFIPWMTHNLRLDISSYGTALTNLYKSNQFMEAMVLSSDAAHE
jgi:hypothetical protein